VRITFLEFLRKSLRTPQRLRPVERKLARQWVKERLKRLFPHLRDDPEALERAYAELGLDAHEGAGRGGGTVFEVNLPSGVHPEE
jgi:hypothetical protein